MEEPTVSVRASKAPSKSKSQLQDDSIMGTNNSSIVSKRSVERLYFPHENHYFRYFVKKPQRRSPLINRGYWLRMQAVDYVVRQFLEQESEKSKVVINLGCGYDPLPWQCFERYPSECKGVTFIDIDYADLMHKKRDTVMSTPQLHSMLTNLKTADGSILLRSDQYVQLGCDLRELGLLQKSLEGVIDLDKSLILFTAEVSITYMDVGPADSLIRWAGMLPDARFCLLEQLLPQGIAHPFAKTMLTHFNKLKTPLRPVRRYPTIYEQENRFKTLGWQSALARNLWQLWGSDDFIDSQTRRSLDLIEPFDEWEEFALFGCHYVLLVAETSKPESVNEEGMKTPAEPKSYTTLPLSLRASYSEYPSLVRRRFASIMPARSSDARQDTFGTFSGMGPTTRVNTIDTYRTDLIEPHVSTYAGSAVSPSGRMCHTTTDLGELGTLLVGGRTSPDTASMDSCWLYHKWLGAWERIADLPQPRYRHQAVHLGHGYVLISPGRLNTFTIVESYLVWSRQTGWFTCTLEGEVPAPTYGSNLILSNDQALRNTSQSRSGVLAGGISENGVLQGTSTIWELRNMTTEPVIFFRVDARLESQTLLSRFGASTACSDDGEIFIVGGIAKDRLIPAADEIVSVNCRESQYTVAPITFNRDPTCPRPLLVGTTVTSIRNSLIIAGGSAVCFSFGTFWNTGCYTLHTSSRAGSTSSSSLAQDLASDSEVWRYSHTSKSPAATGLISNTPLSRDDAPTMTKVPRMRINSPADFNDLVQAGKPVVLEGLDIGACTSLWSPEYLKLAIGSERNVVVHEATTEQMDFTTKNFSYVTKNFDQFIDEVSNGGKLYLRSLSEQPSETPTEISKDFPAIAADFKLPPELQTVTEHAHSSPLRISGPVRMWLHYDVMANVLCQIRGTKRLLLFPPSDVRNFGFQPAASSSSVDVFNELDKYPLSHPHEVLLEPGDVLFLPPLWLHAASPTSGMSVGVNVFFRSLSSGYAAGKDVYGNRDLQAYEKGRQDIARISRSFDGLPVDVRGFYLQRLVDELKGKAEQ